MRGRGDPRVGAVVLTHNRREEVLRTVGRLVELPEQPAIVVVDNASRDGTVEALAERFTDVPCLHMAGNVGAAARNAGVAACNRPYLALCDDDTWWEPGSMARAADVLDAHPTLAIATGRVLVGDPNRVAPACREMAASPLTSSIPLPGPPLVGFHAGASMVRRTAFLQAGGFEPRFFIGGEECLLAFDLLSAGWHIAYVDELWIHHYPSVLRDAPARERLVLRNHLWVTWLRRPLAYALSETLAAVRQSQTDATARAALRDALRGLPWALHHRRVVPPGVERQIRQVES
jgi:N-acetylglucosaminyl-diphospho-decaprenol L-rhamnosyltransferase